MKLACKEFAISVHFYKIYIELMISTWLIHVIVDIEKKKQIPPNKKEVLMVL